MSIVQKIISVAVMIAIMLLTFFIAQDAWQMREGRVNCKIAQDAWQMREGRVNCKGEYTRFWKHCK
ncbi:MAG: hypothetical protein ACXADW_23145 [Candidatus Hodarchaeales archaeon]|jgi:hypothetical protein